LQEWIISEKRLQEEYLVVYFVKRVEVECYRLDLYWQ